MTDGKDSSLIKLLEPYLGVTLAAYDNAKLIYSVLTNLGVEVSGYEASHCFSQLEPRKSIYCLHCMEQWINCGRSNSYAAQISVMNIEEVEGLADKKEISLPILGEQQINALMMQYAHFDHC